MLAVTLPPYSPHQTQRNHIPNSRGMLTPPIPPTKHDIHHLPQWNPMDSEVHENKTPWIMSNHTMSQKVVHRLPTTLAHETPSY